MRIKPDLVELLKGCETLDYVNKPLAREGSIFLGDKYARIYWKGYGNNATGVHTLTLRIGDSALKYLWGSSKNPKTSMQINIFVNYKYKALIIKPVTEPGKYFERALTNNSEISITQLLDETTLDIETGIYEKSIQNGMVIIYLDNKIEYENLEEEK